MVLTLFFLSFMVFVLLAGLIGLWIRFQKISFTDKAFKNDLEVLRIQTNILQDLSLQIDRQSKAAINQIDEKYKLFHKKIAKTEIQIQEMVELCDRSFEIASFFKDKLPYEELMERKKNQVYRQAAQLARQGLTPEEISKTLKLSQSEAEFVSKINKEKMFNNSTFETRTL